MKQTVLSAFADNPVLRDGLVAAGLLCAVLVVYVVDSGVSPSEASTDAGVSEIQESTSSSIVESEPVARLRLGVTPADFDDMGRLLETLGEGYRHEEVQLEELLDPARLQDFDILFLTCGGVPQSWLGEQLNAAARGRGVFRARPEVLNRATDNLRSFVNQGGTLYASDWRFSLVSQAFAELVDSDKASEGVKQTVEAEVVDVGLRELLGGTIELHFDQSGWSPAAFMGKDTVTYLRGRYTSVNNKEVEAPLLVKFPYGEGSVIFTSFHNEKQNSETETELLRYLVFTTVIARTESEVQQTMVAGGFSPASRSLLSASSESPSVTRTWQCKQRGHVQFVLGFKNEGAILRLSVVGPNGTKYEDQSSSTLQINVPDAFVGEWKYIVTAVKVPYANFPFALTIGEKSAN
jgi:hypothetical protein